MYDEKELDAIRKSFGFRIYLVIHYLSSMLKKEDDKSEDDLLIKYYHEEYSGF